jgi:hypothetical protein
MFVPASPAPNGLRRFTARQTFKGGSLPWRELHGKDEDRIRQVDHPLILG